MSIETTEHTSSLQGSHKRKSPITDEERAILRNLQDQLQSSQATRVADRIHAVIEQIDRFPPQDISRYLYDGKPMTNHRVSLHGIFIVLRNGLILVPLIITWLEVGKATQAYQAELALQLPQDQGRSFLDLWQSGFHARSVMPFSQLASIDVGVFFVIIILGIITDSPLMFRFGEKYRVNTLIDQAIDILTNASVRYHPDDFPTWSDRIQSILDQSTSLVVQIAGQAQLVQLVASQLTQNVQIGNEKLIAMSQSIEKILGLEQELVQHLSHESQILQEQEVVMAALRVSTDALHQEKLQQTEYLHQLHDISHQTLEHVSKFYEFEQQLASIVQLLGQHTSTLTSTANTLDQTGQALQTAIPRMVKSSEVIEPAIEQLKKSTGDLSENMARQEKVMQTFNAKVDQILASHQSVQTEMTTLSQMNGHLTKTIDNTQQQVGALATSTQGIRDAVNTMRDATSSYVQLSQSIQDALHGVQNNTTGLAQHSQALELAVRQQQQVTQDITQDFKMIAQRMETTRQYLGKILEVVDKLTANQAV